MESGFYLNDRAIKPPNTFLKNLFLKRMYFEAADINGITFRLQYVADSRETNLFKRVEFVDDGLILLDGAGVTLTWRSD
jgi:hypothetical protein